MFPVCLLVRYVHVTVTGRVIFHWSAYVAFASEMLKAL